METVVVKTIRGREIKVSGNVAQLGFGTVREAEYDGNPCQVKWFSREELARTGCGKELYENVKAHLEQDPPGKYFLWPVDVSEMRDGAFGYVLDKDVDTAAYMSLADLLEERGYYENWSVTVGGALSLITAFLQIREKQYHLLHMTEDDIFIHRKTGQVLIANTEFARKGGKAKAPSKNTAKNTSKNAKENLWRPASVSRMVSPSCVMNQKAADQASDNHMLAVLLFEILYLQHPLEGYQAAACPVMDEEAKRTVYGAKPCFVYDGENDSNQPVRGIHNNMINRWKLYPDYVGEFFCDVFSQETLGAKKPYVSAEQWYSMFVKLRSHIVQCPSCGMENIWQTGERCRNSKCKKPLPQPSLYYHVGERAYPVFPGANIYQCQLEPDGSIARNDFFAVEAGRFLRPKNNSSVCHLQNLTDREWTVTDGNGDEHLLEPRETVILKAGLKLADEGTIISVDSE